MSVTVCDILLQTKLQGVFLQAVLLLSEDKVILILTLITWQEQLMLCILAASCAPQFSFNTVSKSQQNMHRVRQRQSRKPFYLWCAVITVLCKQL